MDSVGMDLQLSDRAYSEYGEDRKVGEESQQTATVRSKTSSDETDSPTTSLSLGEAYETSTDLATSTTVPVSDSRVQERASSSSTSSTSSSDSRMVGTSLYIPEFLTPSISYDRASPQQLLVALIGRAFDQPDKLASQLQQLVPKLANSETPVAKFTPFTVKRKTLCRGYFDSSELKQHDLICLCYNASEARILLTGQDGYYTALLRQIEIQMGPNKVAFLVSNYSSNRASSQPSQPDDRPQPLLPPALRERLNLQQALVGYLEREQVLAWANEPLARHSHRLLELARLEPNPQGLFRNCSVM
ncbi:hypothetical protein GBAR_LOCUS26167 [Geodia barretti]|uniref:Uncharacterized protein n=1 Tax=Geodia barretti TaxID=519541 RepID=A0AA35XE16_GEOBA|nr:hypothetical protein GBAR_LOCUS26167 [Geodia barretti]